MNDVIFTICAKNYLAQALSLKKSTLKHNKNIDFYIFLSDTVDGESLPSGIILLDDSWVKDWILMAYKYDVVEFSTAVKPYAIRKLFQDGYQKVSYIDPDIFVTNKLDYVFDSLENYSAILTPHRCTMMRNGELLDEHAIILNGIFNLGFFAVKNDSVGNSIINWWVEKLTSQCYLDLADGLAVDQKWMEFIPAYFPKDVLISSNLGMNAAIWNIQERELSIGDDGEYIISNKLNPNEKYELLFWHFSGYSPINKDWLLKNNPQTAFDNYPCLAKLGTEYYNTLINNGFERYSKMRYGFNFYETGEVILPLHRRLYRHYEDTFSKKGNPFSSDSDIYKQLQRNHLLTKKGTIKQDPRRDMKSHKDPSSKKVVFMMLRLIESIVGINNYTKIIRAFRFLSVYENHYFLINGKI